MNPGLTLTLQVAQLVVFFAMAVGVIISTRSLLRGLREELGKLSAALEELSRNVSALTVRVAILEDRAERR